MTRSLKVTVVSGRNLLNKDGGIGRKKTDVSDPYCFVIFQGEKKNTKVIEDDLNPVWNETFEFPMSQHLDMGSTLEIKCFDQDIGRDESLGVFTVPLASLRTNPVLEDWYSLHHKKDKNKEWQGEIKLRIQYKSGEKAAPADAGSGEGAAAGIYADAGADEVVGEADAAGVGIGADIGAAGGFAGASMNDAEATVETSVPRAPIKRNKLSARKQNFQVRVHIVEARSLAGVPVKVDPVVKLSVNGRCEHTRTKKKTCSPQWDELFYFDFYESPRNLFDKVVSLEVMNSKTLRSDALIGSFRLDVATIYAQPNHVYYKQWLMLYLPTDIGRGAQGYLQVTMAVLGPGDKMIIPDDYDELDPADIEDADDRVLGPSRVTREPAILTCKIYQGEDMPQMDPNWETGFKPFDKLTRQAGKEQCDPFLEVTYAGCKRKTAHKDNTFSPEWNEGVKIPMPLPVLCNTIKIHAYDKDTAILLNPDDLIGTANIPLKEISAFEQDGFLPTFGPGWVTLYGSPRHFKATPGPKSMRHFEKMNAGVVRGCAYRGRVLLELKSSAEPVADNAAPGDSNLSGTPKAPFPLLPGDIQRASGCLAKRPFKLRVQIISINKMLDNVFDGDQIRAEVSIGSFGLAGKNTPGCLSPLLKPTKGGHSNWYMNFGATLPVLEVTSLWEDKAAEHSRVYNAQHKVVADLRKQLEKPVNDDGDALALAMLLAERLDAAPIGDALKTSGATALDEHFRLAWQREIAFFKKEAQRILKACTEVSPAETREAVSDVADTLEAQIMTLQKSAFPDIIVTLGGEKIGDDRAYCRIPACDVLWAEKEGSRGKLWNKSTNVLLDAILPDEDDKGRVVAQMQLRAWLTYEEEADLRMPAVRPPLAFDFQVRAHIYQARDLLAADDNGLSDPYCVVTCGTQAKRTHIVKDTRSPYWDEVVVLDNVVVLGADLEEALDNIPDIVVEVFDHDKFGSDDFLGTFVAKPDLRSSTKTLPCVLAWKAVYPEADKPIGQVLCGFEILPVADVDAFPLPPAATTKEDMTGDMYSSIPLPIDIRPETELCRVDILAFGVRNLKKCQLLSVKNPHVEYECMGEIIATDPLVDVTKNPNFTNRLLGCEVDLPLKPEYMPPVNIKVYDNRRFGRKVLVGTHSVTTLRDYYHSEEELLQLAEKPSRLTTSAVTIEVEEEDDHDERPLLQGGDASGHRAGGGDAVVDIPEPTPEPNTDKPVAEEEADWWAKFYASQGHPGGRHYPADGDKLQVYQGTLEEEFDGFGDCCSTYPLHRGDANCEDTERVGLLKGSFYARPVSTSHLTPPWDHITDTPVTEVTVRVYAIRAMQLKPADPNGKSDPYVVMKIGDREVRDVDAHHEDTLDPVFGKCYEMTARLPLDQELEISVYDHDFLGNDDLIGTTVIDLENRWLSLHRGTCGLPDTYDVRTWRDVDLPSTILKTWCSRNNRGAPVLDNLEPYGVTAHIGEGADTERFVVRDRAGMNAAHARENACLLALHAIGLVREHVETRTLTNPLLEDADQGMIQLWVDILPHTGAPLRPPVNIAPRQPIEYELRVVIWDVKDAILEETAITGEKMSDLFVRGYMEGQDGDKQETDVHYRSLNGEGNFNWRMVFPVKWLPGEDVMVVDDDGGFFSFGTKADPKKMKPILHLQIWDNDTFSANDYIGYVDIDLSKIVQRSNGRRWVPRLPSKPKPPVNLFEAIKDAGGRNTKFRSWFKCQKTGAEKESVGNIDCSLELLCREEAEAKEVGRGREEPNVHPELPPPKRPDTSFFWMSSPWKVARYVIWKNYKWRIIGLFLLAVLAVLLYYLFTEVPQVQVQNWFRD